MIQIISLLGFPAMLLIFSLSDMFSKIGHYFYSKARNLDELYYDKFPEKRPKPNFLTRWRSKK